jgi:hypothetical protein
MILTKDFTVTLTQITVLMRLQIAMSVLITKNELEEIMCNSR